MTEPHEVERLKKELARARQRIRVLEDEARVRTADQQSLWKNLEIFRTLLDTLPTDHGLGGQPPAAARDLEPVGGRTRLAPALTPPAATGVSR